MTRVFSYGMAPTRASIINVWPESVGLSLRVDQIDALRDRGEWFIERLARRRDNLRRGDVLIVRLWNWHPIFVFDGNVPVPVIRTSIERYGTWNHISREFLVPTRFPADHWVNKGIELFVPLDVATHRAEILSNLGYGVPPGLVLDRPPPFDGSRACYTAFHFEGVCHVLLMEFNQADIRPPEDEVVRVLEAFRELLTDQDILHVLCRADTPFFCLDLGRTITIPADTRVLHYPSECAGIEPAAYNF